MVRNVVMVKLKSDSDPAAIADIHQRMRELDPPGAVSLVIGNDLGLRESNWSFALVVDFVDESAYHAYDLDPEHNRLRALLAPHVAEMARVQIEI